jgi:hypothetical protein
MDDDSDRTGDEVKLPAGGCDKCGHPVGGHFGSCPIGGAYPEQGSDSSTPAGEIKPGTCSISDPRCYCGAEATKHSGGGTPQAWTCGTHRDTHGHVRYSPACIPSRDDDPGPQPEACPHCGARNTRQTFTVWTYACGTVVRRDGSPYQRQRSQDMSERCLDAVFIERDAAVQLLRAIQGVVANA